MTQLSLVERGLKHIWHPCGQMKDYEIFKPLEVTGAKGSYIELATGEKIIDANSSWWCKTLGHNHPRLQKAVLAQINKFEHVILANTTNETITLLSEKLTSLTTSLNKVFYAGDGSSAVEIAMKLSLHSRVNKGETKKTKFIALKNGFHGETLGALSVSDVGIYKTPYQAIVFDTFFISPVPYVSSNEDPLWLDCSEQWQVIEKQLEQHIETTTAVILEPILQASGHMKIYSQDLLQRLRAWTYKHNIHFIADEIMTGIGRTGKMLACQHAGIEPDFICLGKGLTAGWMPFSAILTSDEIYQCFYDDYNNGTSFFHSHTYGGNALGASIVLEVLNIVEEVNLCEQANVLGKIMLSAMREIAHETGVLANIRQIGAVVAAELIVTDPNRRLGFEVYQKAVQLGALLRPLGNTIYWVPPLNTEVETIDKLKQITKAALLAVMITNLAS
ncbi:MAG: adenosylmethionine--8-amino-7-oxononanoate transaminase [Pseudomonadota bacterium]